MKKKELVELIISYFRNKPGDTFTTQTVVPGTTPHYASVEDALCGYDKGNA